MNATPLVQVRNLRRVFDVSPPLLNRIIERTPRQYLTAVDDISFDIGRGETFRAGRRIGSGNPRRPMVVV
jgi:peptide/nickel transport system ATP-binding protein